MDMEKTEQSATDRENREASEEVRLTCQRLGIPFNRDDIDNHNRRASLYSLFWAGYRVGRYWNHEVATTDVPHDATR